MPPPREKRGGIHVVVQVFRENGPKPRWLIRGEGGGGVHGEKYGRTQRVTHPLLSFRTFWCHDCTPTEVASTAIQPRYLYFAEEAWLLTSQYSGSVKSFTVHKSVKGQGEKAEPTRKDSRTGWLKSQRSTQVRWKPLTRIIVPFNSIQVQFNVDQVSGQFKGQTDQFKRQFKGRYQETPERWLLVLKKWNPLRKSPIYKKPGFRKWFKKKTSRPKKWIFKENMWNFQGFNWNTTTKFQKRSMRGQCGQRQKLMLKTVKSESLKVNLDLGKRQSGQNSIQINVMPPWAEKVLSRLDAFSQFQRSSWAVKP